MRPKLLYKIHELEDCDTLQRITKYLYALNIDVRPISIIERSFPKNIDPVTLPTILIENGQMVTGLNAIVDHYEKILGLSDLINKSNQFMNLNPRYQISDKASHKNIIFQ